VPFTGYRVKAGQFIYSRIDARNGAFAIVPPGLDGAVVSKDFPIFDIDEQRVQPSFLLHFMRSGKLERQIQAMSFGATNRQRITEDNLLGMKLDLPPLPEQRRIAAILDQAETLRAKRRQTLQLLDDLTQAVFLEMFGAASAPTVAFGDLCSRMRNGVSPTAGGTESAWVLTLTAITSGRFREEARKEGKFVTSPGPEHRVQACDFLVCRGNGNAHLVGQGCFPPHDLPDVVFPDTMIAASVDAARVLPEYLAAAWATADVRRQIEAGARTTSGIYKINQRTLESISLRLPPFEEQWRFVHRARTMARNSTMRRQALAEADALFASLQSRAFSGRL
jgi:type I restriction enzyme S subunit